MAVENVQQSATRNRILGALPEADFKLIAPSLARVSLEDGETLFHAEDVISHVYFVEGGLISLLSALEDGASIEVGMTGREGVAGVSVLLGADTSVHTALVQTGGEALRMRAGDAREAFRRSEALRNRVLNYTRLLLAYASQTAACNTIHTVEERLARCRSSSRTCSACAARASPSPSASCKGPASSNTAAATSRWWTRRACAPPPASARR
jgi:CRP-like cAMP-binding protein